MTAAPWFTLPCAAAMTAIVEACPEIARGADGPARLARLAVILRALAVEAAGGADGAEWNVSGDAVGYFIGLPP